MNKRLLTVFGFAFVVALVSTLLLYSLLSKRLGSGGQSGAGQDVVVSTHDLPRGALLKDVDVRMMRWAGASVPKGAFTDKNAALGRGVLSEIASGEPILENRLAPKEAGAGLAPSIPVGKRAVSVRVNDVVAVSGYVIPGSRVDILVTGNVPGQAQQGPEIRTLLQNVEVLSAGTNIQRDAEGKPIQVPVITLLVTPEEAEVLSLASNETRIQLVLRNPLDEQRVESPGSALARLFGAPQAPPPRAAAPPRPRKVEVKQEPPPPPPPPPIVVELLKGPSRSAHKFSAEAGEKDQEKPQDKNQ